MKTLRNVIHCAVKTARQEGLAAFYKGFAPSCLRIVSYNIMLWITFEQLKKGVNTLVIGDPNNVCKHTSYDLSIPACPGESFYTGYWVLQSIRLTIKIILIYGATVPANKVYGVVLALTV